MRTVALATLVVAATVLGPRVAAAEPAPCLGKYVLDGPLQLGADLRASRCSTPARSP